MVDSSGGFGRSKTWKESRDTIYSYIDGGLGVDTVQGATFYIKDTCNIIEVNGSVEVAPTDSDSILVDINDDGTTVFTSQGNRLAITTGATTGSTTTIDASTIIGGSYITVDIDQVGNSTAGSNLTVGIVLDYSLS